MTPNVINNVEEPEIIMDVDDDIIVESLYGDVTYSATKSNLFNILPKPPTPQRKNKRRTKKTSFIISSDEYIDEKELEIEIKTKVQNMKKEKVAERANKKIQKAEEALKNVEAKRMSKIRKEQITIEKIEAASLKSACIKKRKIIKYNFLFHFNKKFSNL